MIVFKSEFTWFPYLLTIELIFTYFHLRLHLSFLQSQTSDHPSPQNISEHHLHNYIFFQKAFQFIFSFLFVICFMFTLLTFLKTSQIRIVSHFLVPWKFSLLGRHITSLLDFENFPFQEKTITILSPLGFENFHHFKSIFEFRPKTWRKIFHFQDNFVENFLLFPLLGLFFHF